MLDWSVEQDKYPVVISMPGNGVHPAKYPVASSYDPLNEYQVCEKEKKLRFLLWAISSSWVKRLHEVLKKKPAKSHID